MGEQRKKRGVLVWLAADRHMALKVLAARRQRSMSDLLREKVAELLEDMATEEEEREDIRRKKLQSRAS